MKHDRALEIAAQAWGQPTTSEIVMDVRLAASFAGILRTETTPLEDQLEMAWGIISNAGGGDWTKESKEWQDAAARWRDTYHQLLAR